MHYKWPFSIAVLVYQGIYGGWEMDDTLGTIVSNIWYAEEWMILSKRRKWKNDDDVWDVSYHPCNNICVGDDTEVITDDRLVLSSSGSWGCSKWKNMLERYLPSSLRDDDDNMGVILDMRDMRNLFIWFYLWRWFPVRQRFPLWTWRTCHW